MRKLILFSIFVSAISGAPPVLSYELYRIVAEGCQGGQSAVFQTGFSDVEGAEIITALHGVVGCSKISAQHFVGQVRQNTVDDLVLSQVDVERDLALLSTTHLNGTPHFNSNYPSDDEQLTISGFPQGSSDPDTIPVQLGQPAIRSLRSILRAKDVLRYEQIASPSPNVNIIRLDGNAQVGHSGAPLQNSNGEVVGVVIGGYELGEFGTFWAIPISEASWSPADMQLMSHLASLRGQFSSPAEAPIRIATMDLVCGSSVDDGGSSLSLSLEESQQIAQFAATLEESKDQLIYAQVSITQDGCLACACQREIDRVEDLPPDALPHEYGYVEYHGYLGISADDAPFFPTLWREGYLLQAIGVPEFAVATTFALPLPRHLESYHYRYQADRQVRLGFDGFFITREHFQTGWQMLHLEPTGIPPGLQERLRCIRDHIRSGRTKEAEDWC